MLRLDAKTDPGIDIDGPAARITVRKNQSVSIITSTILVACFTPSVGARKSPPAGRSSGMKKGSDPGSNKPGPPQLAAVGPDPGAGSARTSSANGGGDSPLQWPHGSKCAQPGASSASISNVIPECAVVQLLLEVEMAHTLSHGSGLHQSSAEQLWVYFQRALPSSSAIRTSWLRVLTPVFWKSC